MRWISFKGISRAFVTFAALALVLSTLNSAVGAPASAASEVAVDRLPRVSPDYIEIVLPPNIAPLNFIIQETGEQFAVSIRGTTGKPIEFATKTASVSIPLRQWRKLLEENAGQEMRVEVSAKDVQGKWRRFQTITNHISSEPIDAYLVYRLIGPLYNIYAEMGIYQRCLQDFTETPILRNSSFKGGCVNCHTFQQNRPETMALHIRAQSSGNPMLLARSNEVTKIEQTAGYLSWHPSGRLLAFSANKLSMFCHTVGETRDVFDAASDLRIYRVDSNIVVTPPAVSKTDLLETWPAWTPDGKYLYFCRTPKLPQERFRQIRYDLMRVSYDLEQDEWGQPETLVSGRETGLSAAEPVVSPDGRMVLFCLSKYGNFPPYQPSSDLYVFEPETRNLRRLEINSDRTDSYHCWSSSGRWIVFSSKRRDGLFSRPFFSYVHAKGNFAKPFILPQKDPGFYDSFLKNYNRPELIKGPVEISEAQLAGAVFKPRMALKPKTDAAGLSINPPEPESGRGEPVYQAAPVKK